MIRVDLTLARVFMTFILVDDIARCNSTGREDLAQGGDTVVHKFYYVEFCVFSSMFICGLTFSVAAFLTVFNAGFCARAAARVSSAS